MIKIYQATIKDLPKLVKLYVKYQKEQEKLANIDKYWRKLT